MDCWMISANVSLLDNETRKINFRDSGVTQLLLEQGLQFFQGCFTQLLFPCNTLDIGYALFAQHHHNSVLDRRHVFAQQRFYFITRDLELRIDLQEIKRVTFCKIDDKRGRNFKIRCATTAFGQSMARPGANKKNEEIFKHPIPESVLTDSGIGFGSGFLIKIGY